MVLVAPTITHVRVVLLGEPVAKGRARVTRKGFVYTPAKTRDYEHLLKLAANEAMAGSPPFDCPVRLDVTAVLAIPQSWSKVKQERASSGAMRHTTRPDADNFLKAASDAFNAVVFRDDSLICELSVTKLYGTKPRIEAVVTPLL